VTIQLAHFIKIFFFFPLFLFSYNEIHIKGDINLYSDKLYFDIFDDKWQKIPSNEPMNRAIDYSSISIYTTSKNYSFGYKYNSQGIVKINKGFIETWYYAASDFNTLTKTYDIGYYITEPKIYGILNYYQDDSIFYTKKYKYFNITFNLLRGKQLQYMKVNGTNRENRFLATLKYFYTDKNLVTHSYEDDNYYSGLGSSFDIEFFDKDNKLKPFIGIYNILGFIKWRSITYLEYHFDSKTKYIGDDGYYHYKPFGVGKYKKDVNFYQKLPLFIKYSFEYKNIGDNGLFSNGARFDELFFKYHKYKIGFIPQTKNIVLGVFQKNWRIDISNNLSTHSKFLKLYFDVKFD